MQRYCGEEEIARKGKTNSMKNEIVPIYLLPSALLFQGFFLTPPCPFLCRRQKIIHFVLINCNNQCGFNNEFSLFPWTKARFGNSESSANNSRLELWAAVVTAHGLPGALGWTLGSHPHLRAYGERMSTDVWGSWGWAGDELCQGLWVKSVGLYRHKTETEMRSTRPHCSLILLPALLRWIQRLFKNYWIELLSHTSSEPLPNIEKAWSCPDMLLGASLLPSSGSAAEPETWTFAGNRLGAPCPGAVFSVA